MKSETQHQFIPSPDGNCKECSYPQKDPVHQLKTKRIEWAYPTSTHATRFKKSKTGCYTVEIVYEPYDRDLPPVAMGGFDTIEQARAYANSLSAPWNKLTR